MFVEQNTTQTWNTEDPSFTRCFERSVLVWAPCAFLWVWSLLDIFYMRNAMNRNVPWSWINVSKLVITVALVVLTFVDLGMAIAKTNEPFIFAVDFYTPAVKIASFVRIILANY